MQGVGLESSIGGETNLLPDWQEIAKLSQHLLSQDLNSEGFLKAPNETVVFALPGGCVS